VKPRRETGIGPSGPIPVDRKRRAGSEPAGDHFGCIRMPASMRIDSALM
jgi:hypothetical protein